MKILRLMERCLLLPILGATLFLVPRANAQFSPALDSLTLNPDGSVTAVGLVPPGYRYGLLEVLHGDEATMQWESLISGPLNGASNAVTFMIPDPGPRCIVRMVVGTDTNVPPAPLTGSTFMIPVYGEGGTYVAPMNHVTHVLNRIAYGPSVDDYNTAAAMGVSDYITQQLDPGSIDESGNTALNSRVSPLFYEYLPNSGDAFVSKGDTARYFKGSSGPPVAWKDAGFDDSSWASGPTGIGYGDGEPETELADMANADGNPGYYSFYIRLPFTIDDLNAVDNLVLNIDYDDAIVAYLNGTEVARDNITGSPPLFNTPASQSSGTLDGDAPSTFDLNAFKASLVQGPNVLAIQTHNHSLTSSDCYVNAELASVSGTPYPAIRGVRELQHLIHLRGVYSKRQLQAVLGEFWENHFTTEMPKVEDYFRNLDEYEDIAGISQSDENRIELQAEIEALGVEFAEYDFLYQNALGNFGDLLLYSATSPAMLIYLDSVLNIKGAPNENYAREILELSAFGVDNRYTQTDIEELAKCFTGWTVKKIRPEDQQPFPQSARTPPTDDQIAIGMETTYLDLGENWSYHKGVVEPTPGAGGVPTTAWAQPGYVEPAFDPGLAAGPADDTGWQTGPSGLGYSDNDDATVLSDMRNNYSSVYLRKELTLPDPSSFDDLILEIDYDDGFVAYLNGTEIARSRNMNEIGNPPAFNAFAGESHEAGRGDDAIIRLAEFANLINPEPALNTLAIQLHNSSIGSSDASIRPRILGVEYTPGSIDVTEPNAIWTFRFDPDQHNTEAKTLFIGTRDQINIPADQTGAAGVDEAISIIDALVSHPSTAEFICVKLVNRFVSDEISLDTYHDESAPEYLISVVDDAIAAWNSTAPAGNIATVITAILDPFTQVSAFWLEGAHLGKVKNPIEFINSSFRALGADINDGRLPIRTIGMGMNLFTRPEPDGFDEIGSSWSDTQGLLERMKFGQGLSENMTYSYGDWDVNAMMASNGLSTPQDLVDHFNTIVFSGTLSAERQAVLDTFANTDDTGASSPFENLGAGQQATRLRKLTSLILAAPEFQYQ